MDMNLFFYLLLMMNSFFMFFLNHPLSMGLFILAQTMIICITVSMMIKTYWFSYILFLTFLGGLLVLFIYVSSVASNEMFKPSNMMKMMFSYSFFMITLLTLLIYNNSWNMNINYDTENYLNFYFFFNNENKINLIKLYNEQTFLMMIMLIIYLFITLIAVVKITNIFFGPLRSNF